MTFCVVLVIHPRGVKADSGMSKRPTNENVCSFQAQPMKTFVSGSSTPGGETKRAALARAYSKPK